MTSQLNNTEIVLHYLHEHPAASNSDLYSSFPSMPQGMLRRLKNAHLKELKRKIRPSDQRGPEQVDQWSEQDLNSTPVDPPHPEIDLTEEGYKQLLKHAANMQLRSDEPDIRVITEFRNYLDKTAQLRTKTTDLVEEIDPAALQSQFDEFKQQFSASLPPSI